MNEDILPLMLSGKYLPAIGLVLIALVGAARAGLGSFWPWFKTKPGGYVLGYGSTVLLFVGAAFRDGSGFSLGLLGGALAMGWTASGGWETARDVVEAIRNRNTPALPKATAIAGAALVAFVVASSLVACGPVKDAASTVPGSAIIDCTKTNLGELESAAKEIAPLLAGLDPKWDAAADKAKGFAVNVGGCVLFDLAQKYLSKRQAIDSADSREAYGAIEAYRADVAGGATFRTELGDL